MNLEYSYLIIAPNYRESSLGIQVLHRLCHMINERGGHAWMVGCDVNPQWNTPVCTEQVFDSLVTGGKPWLAVYPEVVKGNPLNAPAVVRFMLNREGVIEGNGIDAGDDDLFFWYRNEFADKEPEPNILGIECYDLNDFQNDQPVKDIDLLYINRVPISVIDLSSLPRNITILSMENPLSLKELSRLLKRARILYTYESSGTCVLANLCGCPVVALTAPGYEKYGINPTTLKDIGGLGISFSDAPDAVEAVRASLYKVRDYMLFKRNIMEEQLSRFLDITQNKLSQIHQARMPFSFNTWINTRKLPCEMTSTALQLPRLLHIVFCRQASLDAIATTIDSIAPGFDDTQNILLMVGLPEHVAIDDGKKIFAATSEDWRDKVKNLALEERFDWLHCIDAGVHYAPEGIPLMQYMLQQAGECHAIYTDEVLENTDGTLHPYFKPDFNLDLFLSSPQRYLRRVFFSRTSWLEAGGFAPAYSVAFEFELLIRYIFQWDIGCIGHVSEVCTIVPEESYAENCSDEEQQVIGLYLQQRGFNDAGGVMRLHGAWQLKYQGATNEKVSILIDSGHDLQNILRCVQSLLEVTDWPELEILIALPYNASEGFTQSMVSFANQTGKIRLFAGHPEHNFAMRMNQLEHQAQGEYLCLVSSHSLFLMKDWLSTLINHIVRPEVGCVGPKVISPGKKVLSAGIITGADGWLGHIGQGESWLSEGYLARYQCEQNYSALSGNCLLVKRSAWQGVGGIDSSYDNEFVEDVILSLSLRSAGFLCVWTPYSVIASDNPRLLRDNSLAGHDAQMTRLMQAMPQIFAEDPAYNRNLTLSLPLYRVDSRLAKHWDPLSVSQAPLVLLDEGGGKGMNARRMRTLLKSMDDAGYIRLAFIDSVPTLPELMREKPSAYILSGAVSAISSELVAILKTSFSCRVLGLADDIQDEKTQQWYTSNLDCWLTFYPGQYAYLKKSKQQVQCLPKGLTEDWFRVSEETRFAKAEKMRILCIPRGWKQKELNFMQSIIAASANEIDWVIVGEWPKNWIPYVKETRRFVQGDISPQQLLELNVDAAVIFHSGNDFSRTRDAHLIYQLVACQIPVVASDVDIFACDVPVTRVKADHKKWLQALDMIKESRLAIRSDDISLSQQAKSHYQLKDHDLIEASRGFVA